ncbi:MAG TPA: hypothetical protein V6C52_05030 [Coleofasciculaceae cyanobacterium]|jgi:hypothetical protein
MLSGPHRYQTSAHTNLQFSGGAVKPRQLKVAMRALGFEEATGGRHALHYTNGHINIPCVSGGHAGDIGPTLLGNIAHELGVPPNAFREFVRDPKRRKLDIIH